MVNSTQYVGKMVVLIIMYKIIWWEAAMECLATEQPSHFHQSLDFVLSPSYAELFRDLS
jgi:hypothetical protein